MKERNVSIDILRGVAIFLVIWGHAIQYCAPSGSIDIFDYPMFDFIYSFHMPLLMLISGYLFFYSSNGSTIISSLKKIIQRITIPHVLWSVVISLYIIFTGRRSIGGFLDFLLLNKETFFSLWFLCALVYCYLITIIVKQFLKDSVWAYLIIWILISIIPILGNVMYVWMYPYFVAGYWINKKNLSLQPLFEKYGKFLVLALFPIMVVNWATSFYVYTTGIYLNASNIPSQLFYNGYRLLAGFAGCGYFYVLVELLKKVPFTKRFQTILVYAGKNSLAIYMIQTIIIENFIGNYVPDLTYSYYLYTYGLCFAISCVVIGLIILIAEGIKKVKILNQLLLGGR